MNEKGKSPCSAVSKDGPAEIISDEFRVCAQDRRPIPPPRPLLNSLAAQVTQHGEQDGCTALDEVGFLKAVNAGERDLLPHLLGFLNRASGPV